MAALRASLCAALVLAALLSPQPAAGVAAISGWQQGLVTFFGGGPDGMDPGSPSYGTKEVGASLLAVSGARRPGGILARRQPPGLCCGPCDPNAWGC